MENISIEEQLKKAKFTLPKKDKEMLVNSIKTCTYNQVDQEYFSSWDDKIEGCCAIGAYLLEINDEDDVWEYIENYDNSKEFLDFGCLSENKRIDEWDLSDYIVSMNDNSQYSFEKIADIINKYVGVK